MPRPALLYALGQPRGNPPPSRAVLRSRPEPPAQQSVGGAPGAGASLPPDIQLRQTFIFDLADLSLPYSRGPDLGRMPKGQPIELRMESHQSLTLMLGTYRFVLVAGEPYRLVDDTDTDSQLSHGKNIIGRGGRSDVVVDACCTSVSRQHLILDVGSHQAIRLTDISSYGSSLAVDYLPAG
jgi:hypothetical protein